MLLLENLDVLLAKMSEDDIRTDILPMAFAMLESNSIQGQARYVCLLLSRVYNMLPSNVLRSTCCLLPPTKLLPVCCPSVAGYKGIQVDRNINMNSNYVAEVQTTCCRQ